LIRVKLLLSSQKLMAIADFSVKVSTLFALAHFPPSAFGQW